MKLRTTIMGIVTSMMALLGCNAQNSYQSINVDEFEKAISDEDVVCLDVRSEEEFVEGHIAQAIFIDVKQPQFEKRALASLPKDKTIAVYCRSGNRSKKACGILAKNGYKVVELNSGIIGWQAESKPTTKEEVDVFTAANGTKVYVHCIKHGSLSMQIGDKWIYIDPVAGAVQPATDYAKLPKAGYILVTHEHQDHLDAKAIEQLTKEGTELITNHRCKELLGGKGYAMKNGDSKAFGSWTIDAVPAYNTSADKQQFHPKGRDNGYVLTIEGLRFYIAGDTEDTPEMANIKDIDVAFMPCNLPFTMSPEQLANAARTIMPKVLFPYHYGKTDIKQAQQLLDETGIDVRIRQYQ